MGDAIEPKQDVTSYVWTLVNGEARHAEHPDTFELPDRKEREQLGAGHFAKLIFVTPSMLTQNLGERMWVRVLERKQTNGTIVYRGVLDNSPQLVAGLEAGKEITFGPENVIDIESTKPKKTNGGGGGALVLLAFVALSGKKRRRRR